MCYLCAILQVDRFLRNLVRHGVVR